MTSLSDSQLGAPPPAAARPSSLRSRITSVLRHYGDLGFTSFGGPGVHVIILRRRFVDKLRWVDERTFVDLFALGNALPGPGSTQLAFSIAVVSRGVLPGLVAFLCWSLPGAIGMGILGAGIERLPTNLDPTVLALLTGLNASAVGLIALAAEQLGKSSATDRITTLVLWLSASVAICYHAPWVYPVLTLSGGIATLLWDRRLWIFKGIKTCVSGGRRKPRQTEAAEERFSHRSGRQNRPDSPQDLELEQRSPSIATASLSTIRQRPVTVPDTPSEERAATPPVQSAATPPISPRTSAFILAGFVLLLVVPLATRGAMLSHSTPVPRALDVSPLHLRKSTSRRLPTPPMMPGH